MQLPTSIIDVSEKVAEAPKCTPRWTLYARFPVSIAVVTQISVVVTVYITPIYLHTTSQATRLFVAVGRYLLLISDFLPTRGTCETSDPLSQHCMDAVARTINT